ncbi:hypothetical protein [Nocardia sp. NPDC050435]|uniref:hypothetical protein n=1 Tax=Nocardia sp. NPDC050435 TaxID=3155040 RepID=UPI0033F781B5
MDQDAHERTCGYWYTVRAGGTAHVAFRNTDDLEEWLTVCALALPLPVPYERGTSQFQQIIGCYNSISHRDVQVFGAIQPIVCIPFLENAEYTLGKVTEDANGVRSVHFLNVNDRDGVFPWPRRRHFNERRKDVLDYIATRPALAFPTE